MRKINIVEKYRCVALEKALYSVKGEGYNGIFLIKCPLTKKKLKVVSSDEMGWEHVSVSLENRDPLWKEMCFIKDLFWDEDEVVIQYHPKKKDYVNMHKHCLHLWKPLDQDLPIPDSVFVGLKGE